MIVMMLQSPEGECAEGTYSLPIDKDIAVFIERSVIGYIGLAYRNSVLQMKYTNSGKMIFKSEVKILLLLFLKIFLRTYSVCLWELCG